MTIQRLTIKKLLLVMTAIVAATFSLPPIVSAQENDSIFDLPSGHILRSRPPCEGQQNMVLMVITKNHFIYICSGSSNSDSSSVPRFYEGYAKDVRRGNIRLPITRYSSDRSGNFYYVAVNENTRYLLNSTEILVTRGNRTVLREGLIWSCSAENAEFC